MIGALVVPFHVENKGEGPMNKAVCRILAALLASVSVAGAAERNTGGDAPLPKSPNVLTPPGKIKKGGPVNILYAPSEADDPAYRTAIAAITGGTVDYFDAVNGTPTVAQMAPYDCVYTWANFAYNDNVTMGNNLATFVDGGGRAILGAFCTFTSGNFLSGQIMTPAYSPVVSPSGTNHFSNSQYAGDGVTCIHNELAAVTTYSCQFRDFLALQGGGIQDGSYLDNEIAHAFRASDGNVVYSNGSGASQLGCAGQWAALIANICACTTLPVELQGISVE
jgi:hypothetical protein